jgi:preprotein translocase subunit SecE
MAKDITEKPNRIGQFISTTYKFENFILIALAIFAIVFGVLILNGTLTIPETAFIVGSFGNVFAWILVGLGAISLVIVAIPFYRPSIDEIQHVKGYKVGEFFRNVLIVIAFTIVLAILFFLFDLLIESVIGWLK